MQPAEPREVTVLLKAWSAGEESALDRLTTIVHGELRRIARHHMRNQRMGNTLQATALVNEVYLRLIDVKDVEWQHRAQFFAFCATAMRNILVDAARARGAHKRGGDLVRISVDGALGLASEPAGFILTLHEALEEFAKTAPRPARVVELRYFGGLNEEETAEVMKTSLRTVQRDWQFAKAWLQHEMDGGK